MNKLCTCTSLLIVSFGDDEALAFKSTGTYYAEGFADLDPPYPLKNNTEPPGFNPKFCLKDFKYLTNVTTKHV